MKSIYTLLLVVFLFSCSSDQISKSESSEYIGRWKLIQTGYGDYDPVTGEFVYTNSDITNGHVIQFHSNGYIETPMDYCQTNNSSVYLYPYFVENKSIKPECFSGDENFIEYHLAGDTLIIDGPCVEGCREKYIRTED